MRKILSFLALALAFTACQNEPVETISNSGLVEVTLHVDAPEMEITRGLDGDSQGGRNSALGAIDFFNDADWAKYDVRYILEVYDKDDDGTGEPIYLERLVNCLDKYAATNFTLRLVPEREYKFVLFADFVADGNHTKVEPADKLAIADWYYNTADLRNITIKSDAKGFNAMNEARDAYFASKNLTISATGLNQSITLTRPFAKLRVIATDLDYIAGYSAPAFVEVTYHTEKVIKSFNAVSGKLSTEELTGKELTHSFEVKKAEPYNEGYDALSTNQTLFADYIFAKEGEQTTVNFTMAVYEDAAKTRPIKTTDFNTQIPVQRNHLTTIIGDILTNEANIEIKIDDNFVDEWIFGAGDGNKTVINTWGSGIMDPATGDYSFDITAEGNTFHVTVDKTAVRSATLATGDYQFTDKEVTEGKFTATSMKADDTRAMVDVNVVGGMMKVESLNGVYGVVLELVLDYGTNDLRHATYYHEGAILFGETLDAPKATAVAEGNTVTVSWEAIDKATTYYVRLVAEGNEFEATTELSKTYTDLAWETLYQFEVYATNDTLKSVTATVEATTEAEPVVEQAYKIYFQNLAEWAEVYAHIWANEGEDLGLESVEWPGRQLTETEVLDGVTYYVFQLPATATGKTVNVVFNNGAGTQTDDLAGVVEGNLFFDNYVEPVEPTDVKLYLNTGSDWFNDNGGNVWFAAYFFGAGETWVKMNAVEGEQYLFETNMPEGGYTHVIFTMMFGDKTGLDWGSRKNQTIDITLPTDGSNCYTIENPWDQSKEWKAWGSWSTYTPAGSEPVEPTALATPVVTAEISDEYVTLSWEAIEGAKDYTATYGENSQVVEGTTATFDAVVGTYTATVVANPADTTKNTVSEAGTIEVVVEAPVVEPIEATVAEFLAAAEDDTQLYILRGTITNVANTTYGNFDLADETGTVYIYGLCSPEGAQKYWEESGAQLGDDIVIKTIRTSFNGSPQGKNAIYVDLVSPGTLAFYTVSTNAVDFTSVGGEQVINVTAYNTDAAVTATSDNSTFAVNVDGYNVTVSAAANELEQEVTGNITIKVGDLAETVVKASLAAKPAAGVVEGGSSDFNTIATTNTSYVSGKTTAGWVYTNCAIFKGGTSDSSPAFKMIGDASNRALCMNGKTSAVGTITSPAITTGCGTLKFNYGLPFGDTKIKFTVDIMQNGEIVKTFTVDNSSATKLTKYSFEEAIDVAGEFQIVFKNLSPSNQNSNKDRTAIWDVEWTGYNN